jgi:hypothetical protein
MYIDYQFYTNTYLGEPINESDFVRYETRAAEAVDSMTRYVVAQKGLVAFDDFTQQQFKKAVAAQAEFYTLEGIEVATQGVSQASFTVGKVSVEGSTPNGANTLICAKACQLLEPTGLLYRGV